VNSGDKQTILIAGGSGLIGSRLADMLVSKNYRVLILSRAATNESENIYHWDPEKQIIDKECIRQADVVINLAGENISEKRWTARRKRHIVNSRIFSTRLLTDSIKHIPNNIRLFISASAIGYYGHTDEMIMHEDHLPGNDFLASVCQRWEKAAEDNKIRTVIFRIGQVLSENGGVMKELERALKFRIAPVFGTGKQYQSWVHLEDLCRMFVKAIRDDSVSGIYNAVAPGPLSNYNFIKLITHIRHGNYLLIKIPAILLKIILGELSLVITGGTRASSDKIESTGFLFTYPKANSALKAIFEK